jgi:alkylation response protein AidB-like acyl-CoA dehydrogenase
MDITFTAEQEEFRSELRAWLETNPPWGEGRPAHFDDLGEEVAFLRDIQARLAQGRWVGVYWPEEYGGRGTGPAEHYIVQEELARAHAPELVGRIGVNLAGPTLLAHGTAQQKTRWLPKILSAAEIWCQLFSEPGAGSDLAALSTRAERVDGGWRLTGQKVWTSFAQFADWGICLARTDPDARKHRGITYMVVDMHAEGVTVRPLVQLTDEAEFNEVFLDGVFVPDDQVIGEVNTGWQVASSTLSHERGTSPRQLVKHMTMLDDLLRLAAKDGADSDPLIRQRLGEAYAEVRLFQLHNWRTLSRLEKGLEPGPEGSMLKLYWSEMSQRFHDTVMEVLGPAAPLWRGATDNPGDGAWQRSYLYYQSATIFAGTSEIQRNIIGERVLGLPREPRAEPRAAAQK